MLYNFNKGKHHKLQVSHFNQSPKIVSCSIWYNNILRIYSRSKDKILKNIEAQHNWRYSYKNKSVYYNNGIWYLHIYIYIYTNILLKRRTYPCTCTHLTVEVDVIQFNSILLHGRYDSKWFTEMLNAMVYIPFIFSKKVYLFI